MLVYRLAVAIYRIFLSLLRSVPGPLLGRFSIAWQLWHTVRGDYHIAVRDIHRKYGEFYTPYIKRTEILIKLVESLEPCVRTSHVEISVSDPESVKNILIRPLDKHTWYEIFAMPDSCWQNQMSELNVQKFAAMPKKNRWRLWPLERHQSRT